MNIRSQHRVILHGEFKNDIPIGQFNDQLTDNAIDQFVVDHNFGCNALKLIEKRLASTDYHDVIKLHDDLLDLFESYSAARFMADKKSFNPDEL